MPQRTRSFKCKRGDETKKAGTHWRASPLDARITLGEGPGKLEPFAAAALLCRFDRVDLDAHAIHRSRHGGVLSGLLAESGERGLVLGVQRIHLVAHNQRVLRASADARAGT